MRNIFIYITVIVLMTSCATHSKIEYVDREVVRYQVKEFHDTIINNVHDSIYHSVTQNGDTIYDTKYVEKVRYIKKVVEKHDTVYEDRVVTKISEKVVERKVVPKWCWYCLGFRIIFAIFVGIKIYRWIR